MTEEEALASSTGWTKGEYIGYLGFHAANFLVGTGKYQFHQSCCWGYTLKNLTYKG
jgi:hypothetical protein